MLKRYLMFAGDTYYPIGGWGDFKSDHDTSDEAAAAGRAWALVNDNPGSQWWHVVDTDADHAATTEAVSYYNRNTEGLTLPDPEDI